MIKFSIITSTLNSSKHIEKCLKSVANQTYRNFEHLIVDGGSMDNTTEIVKRYENFNLKIVCSERDNGIYHAWNKGLKFSTGDWIITLGSDDYFISENNLECIANFIDSQDNINNIDFLYAETSDDNEMIVIERNNKYFPLLRGVTAYPTAVFINKSLIERGKKFDESYKICGDHKFFAENDFWNKALYIPYKIYHFNQGGVSTNEKFRFLNYIERKRMLSELGRRRPLIFELYYYLRAIV